jgi:hypothetical protein
LTENTVIDKAHMDEIPVIHLDDNASFTDKLSLQIANCKSLEELALLRDASKSSGMIQIYMAKARQLTPKTLGILILIYAITSPLLHQLWFALRGFSPDSLSAFFAMFVGDLLGTLIIVYSIKLLLAFIRMKQSERI